ncbi:MAG: hypothetical protein LBE13_12365 [Bacteroidales bacterium]|jgi:hypothetical protein|nr:hypothetical protein [Bacteroidales bacterium]
MVYYDGKQIIEGIDKITVILHPILRDFITLKNFDSTGKLQVKGKSYWSPKYKKWCINYYYLYIQAEYIDLEKDLRITVAQAVYELIKNDVIVVSNNIDSQIEYETFRYHSELHNLKETIDIHKEKIKELAQDAVNYNKYLDFNFIYENLECFVLKIREIELFFDIRPEYITIPETTYCLDYLKVSPDRETIYSGDYIRKKRTSILIKYNRAECLKKRNQISRKVIDKYPNKIRIEFKLYLNNRGIRVLPQYICGNYDTFISYISDFLAVVYKQYFLDNIIIDSPEHYHLNKIIKLAREIPYSTYRGPIHKAEYQIDYDNIKFTKNSYYYYKFTNFLLRIEYDISNKNKEITTSERINRMEIMMDYYNKVRYKFFNDKLENDLVSNDDDLDSIFDELLSNSNDKSNK